MNVFKGMGEWCISVGQHLREQPSPSGLQSGPYGSPSTPVYFGRSSPSMSSLSSPSGAAHRNVSPLPRWAQGDGTNLLYQELTSDDEYFSRGKIQVLRP